MGKWLLIYNSQIQIGKCEHTRLEMSEMWLYSNEETISYQKYRGLKEKYETGERSDMNDGIIRNCDPWNNQ